MGRLPPLAKMKESHLCTYGDWRKIAPFPGKVEWDTSVVHVCRNAVGVKSLSMIFGAIPLKRDGTSLWFPPGESMVSLFL